LTVVHRVPFHVELHGGLPVRPRDLRKEFFAVNPMQLDQIDSIGLQISETLFEADVCRIRPCSLPSTFVAMTTWSLTPFSAAPIFSSLSPYNLAVSK
jgi:hypothetical protein